MQIDVAFKHAGKYVSFLLLLHFGVLEVHLHGIKYTPFQMAELDTKFHGSMMNRAAKMSKLPHSNNHFLKFC
jgi:hypothetical protein